MSRARNFELDSEVVRKNADTRPFALLHIAVLFLTYRLHNVFRMSNITAALRQLVFKVFKQLLQLDLFLSYLGGKFVYLIEYLLMAKLSSQI